MKLIIREMPEPGSHGLVAVLEDYDGPVPRAGEYIVVDDTGAECLSVPGNNIMAVKSVLYGIIERRDGLDHFTGRDDPVIEIWV